MGVLPASFVIRADTTYRQALITNSIPLYVTVTPLHRQIQYGGLWQSREPI